MLFHAFYPGIFRIPVDKLIPPATNRLIRVPDDSFVASLKSEMLHNRTIEVAPIIGVLWLQRGEEFDEAKLANYTYECIGGNHTWIALQQLLAENKDLSKDEMFTHRNVSVYVNLTDEQSQHLAHRHNRATEFVNKMTTQDKVSNITAQKCSNSK